MRYYFYINKQLQLVSYPLINSCSHNTNYTLQAIVAALLCKIESGYTKLFFDIKTWARVIPSYLFNITEYIYILPLFLQLLIITRNTINETAIVTRYFTIISRVVKWHAALFKGALLIKITTISMLFVYLNSTTLEY